MRCSHSASQSTSVVSEPGSEKGGSVSAQVFVVSAEDFDDYNGICLACGEIQYGGVEPDARAYPCESCGAHDGVYGLEEALLMDRVTIGN